MELKLQDYINKFLKKAHYEYDESVKAWGGWIVGVPGIYAQGKTVEEVRSELILILEEHLLLSLRKGKKVPGFSHSVRTYAKTH